MIKTKDQKTFNERLADVNIILKPHGYEAIDVPAAGLTLYDNNRPGCHMTDYGFGFRGLLSLERFADKLTD